MDCTQAVFKGMPDWSYQYITHKVRDIGSTGIVNVDEILEYSVLAYMKNYLNVGSKLSNILAFTAYHSVLTTERLASKHAPVPASVQSHTPQLTSADKLVPSLSFSAIITYDEFRSLVRIVDQTVEERAVIRMFGDALLAYTGLGVSTYGFLNVCRDAGLFGTAANKTEVLESIVVHAQQERKELQKLLVTVWQLSEPLFERKLLETGTRRQDIDIAEYGQMHNRIAAVGRLISAGKAPQQAMREYRLLAMDINLFCGFGHLGEGWKPPNKANKGTE